MDAAAQHAAPADPGSKATGAAFRPLLAARSPRGACCPLTAHGSALPLGLPLHGYTPYVHPQILRNRLTH